MRASPYAPPNIDPSKMISHSFLRKSQFFGRNSIVEKKSFFSNALSTQIFFFCFICAFIYLFDNIFHIYQSQKIPSLKSKLPDFHYHVWKFSVNFKKMWRKFWKACCRFSSVHMTSVIVWTGAFICLVSVSPHVPQKSGRQLSPPLTRQRHTLFVSRHLSQWLPLVTVAATSVSRVKVVLSIALRHSCQLFSISFVFIRYHVRIYLGSKMNGTRDFATPGKHPLYCLIIRIWEMYVSKTLWSKKVI